MTEPGLTKTDGVRVAIDTTPLIGPQTGIGRFVSGLVDSLKAHSAIEAVPFAMTAHDRTAAAPNQKLPLPARPMRAIWEHSDWPTIEQWTGTVNLVHGTNYVVPPSRRTRLVSVHDLTAIRYPEMCTADVVRMPILLRRAIRAGAHVHTDSAFVANMDLLTPKLRNLKWENVSPLETEAPVVVFGKGGRVSNGRA
jgi:hypothetical protein